MTRPRPRTFAQGQGQGLLLKAKAKDLTFKAKAKDSKFVLEDTSRPRTKAKDNNCQAKRSLDAYAFLVRLLPL